MTESAPAVLDCAGLEAPTAQQEVRPHAAARLQGRGASTSAAAIPRLEITRLAPRIFRLHAARSAIRVAVLLAGDLTVMLVLRGALLWVRDGGALGPFVAGLLTHGIPAALLHEPSVALALVLGLATLDTYGASDRRRDAARIIAGATLGLLLPFWIFLTDAFSLPLLLTFLLVVGLTGSALVGERYLVDAAVRALWPMGPGAARALLLASPADTRKVVDHPALMDGREFRIVGMLDPGDLRDSANGQWLRRLCDTIRALRADTIVLVSPMEEDAFAGTIDAAAAAGCQAFALTRAHLLSGVEPRVVWRRGAPLVALTRPALRGRQLLLKRSLDILVAGAALITLLPLFALIALAVRVASRGPVFFRQLRVGLGGSTFKIVKFRSMVTNAEALRDELQQRSVYADPRLFKVKDDPRVTRFGGLLRRTSLDELPQLWNVLVGDMSLVGPRPPLPSEVELYEEHHYTRFDVKPGMTGPWQINGRNDIADFEQVIRLESEYMRDWTIWKDFAIMLKTIPTVLRMRGAH